MFKNLFGGKKEKKKPAANIDETIAMLDKKIKDMELGKRVAVYNWAKTGEKVYEFLKIGGLAIGGVALGGGCLIAGWKGILLAKALMSTLTLEKLLTINNFIYFICSLVNDGGGDYRKNQEFWY